MTDHNWQTWVWVRWKPGTASNAWENWRNHPKIKGAWSTIGDWDCVFWLNLSHPDEVEDFVWKEIRRNEWVSSTQTTFVKQWW